MTALSRARAAWWLLRPEEELLVLDAMASPFREIAQLAALTLMRMTEIRRLRREDVHLEQGVILLPQAKAGARPVILSAAAQKVLPASSRPTTANWSFPARMGARTAGSRSARRSGGPPGWRGCAIFGSMTCDTTEPPWRSTRGFTAPIVMALGGRKTERMMRRYAAVTDQTLRAAAEAVSGSEVPLRGVTNVVTPRHTDTR